MKHTSVLYLDEINNAIATIETIIENDREADADLKKVLFDFVHKFDLMINSKLNQCYIVDLRPLNIGQAFYPKKPLKEKP